MEDMHERFVQEHLRDLERALLTGATTKAHVLCRAAQDRCICRGRDRGGYCTCGNGFDPAMKGDPMLAC